MNSGQLYEKYHGDRIMQRKTISRNNFTYKNLTPLIDKYFEGKSVLDIGSGVGTMDFYMANMGKQVVGLEVSKSAVSIARKNANLLGLADKLNFHKADFMRFNASKNFDCILFSEVLEHLPDDEKAIGKVYKFLKKGGVLIVSSPLASAPLYRLGLLKSFDKDVGHLRRYTKSNFVSLLRKHKFKIVKVIETEGILRNFLFTNKYANKLVRFIKGPFVDLVTFVDNLTIPIFGASDIIVVAKK